ncbi:MAG: GNAT family N-acetyltransferase [Anaerolineae bacterium]|nr:GNAT family N-acetyltransferase [Anaerolineae bacterium]
MQMQGNQIALRDWQVADLEIYRFWTAPDHLWQQLDAPYYAKPTAEESEASIASVKSAITAGKWPHPRRRMVIADRNSDSCIGQVSWYWISEETYWPAVGIVIYDPTYWGQGKGFEALGLWSDYLFGSQPEFARLDLRTWSGNSGMMRLAGKLGYQLEARFRKARIVIGEYYDGLGYGILREEWTARYPNCFAAHLAEIIQR